MHALPAESLTVDLHEADALPSEPPALLAEYLPEATESANSEAPALPTWADATALVNNPPETPPEMVEGIVHRGSKLVLAGGSKTNKTWVLLDLAISIAYGEPWLSWKVRKGRVLYINFEIQPAFIAKRLDAILRAKNIASPSPGQLQIWNLRGHCAPFDVILPRITAQAQAEDFSLVILDPLYKLLGAADENKATDIAALLNAVDMVAVAGNSTVAFGAHFSKGNQAAKESIDRISGSGVFARDPDALLIFTAHQEEACFTVEPTLRNCPPVEPFVVRFDFPLMRRTEHDPALLKQAKGSKREPTEADFLAMLPAEAPADNPRLGVLNTNELKCVFTKRGFAKEALAGIRDSLEALGKIRVIQRPRNEKLVGLPAVAKAYESTL